jgi:hypothetical protein
MWIMPTAARRRSCDGFVYSAELPGVMRRHTEKMTET